MNDIPIGRCEAEEVIALRHAVLRPHTTVDMARFAEDDRPGTAHFCARSPEGEVVCAATVWPEPPPWAVPSAPVPAPSEAGSRRGGAWRLRAMATAEGWRGRGLGAGALDAALAHVAAEGGDLIWCNARLGAQAFYERAGMQPWGPFWEEPVIGAHVVMFKRVGTRMSG